VEQFLTDLAVEGRVSASTQNQALNALVLPNSTRAPGSARVAIRACQGAHVRGREKGEPLEPLEPLTRSDNSWHRLFPTAALVFPGHGLCRRRGNRVMLDSRWNWQQRRQRDARWTPQPPAPRSRACSGI
jgi:hypothetical protein